MKKKLLSFLLVGIMALGTACSSDSGPWKEGDDASGGHYKDNVMTLLAEATFDNCRVIQGSYHDNTARTQRFDTDTVFFYNEVSSGQKYGFPILYSATPGGAIKPYCNKEGCLHNDAFCNAYNELLVGNLFTIDGQLYYYQNGNIERSEDGFYELARNTTLYSITPDGMEQLCWFDKTYDDMANHRILVSGKYMYTFITEMSEDVVLSSTDLSSGKTGYIAKLFDYNRDIPAEHMIDYQLPSGEVKQIAGRLDNMQLLAISDDRNYVIFSQTAWPTIASSGLYKRTLVKVLDIYNDTVTILRSCDSERPNRHQWGELEYIEVYNGYIYKVDSASGTITRMKIGSEEWETVYDYSADDPKDLMIKYFEGNKMICHERVNTSKTIYKAIVIDLDTFEASENLIKVNYSMFANPQPPTVYDMCENYMVIRTEDTMDLHADLAFISKDDYYASRKNLIEIGHVKGY